MQRETSPLTLLDLDNLPVSRLKGVGVKKEEVYDYDTNTSTMEWKLMRETEMMEQAVEIEYFGGFIFLR